MIYVGNGIYSDATPNEYIKHYGVLGMKWGVHRARAHEQNIYRYNVVNGMNKKKAKNLYKNRMKQVKEYAKKNKGTSMKIKDIEKPSFDKASSKITNYKKFRKGQKIRTGVAAGLVGVGSLSVLGGGIMGIVGGKTKRKATGLNRGIREDLFSARKGRHNGMGRAYRSTMLDNALEKRSERNKIYNQANKYYNIGDTLTKAGIGLMAAGAGTAIGSHLYENKKLKKKNRR